MTALVVDTAKRRAGNAAKLSAALFEVGGTNPHGGPLSENAITNWCRGEAQPAPSMLFKIARIAQVSLDFAAGLHGTPAIVEAPETDADLAKRLAEVEGVLREVSVELRRRRPQRRAS
jgi:transcriptional regulator with XRE-family HTH domain